MNLVEKVGKRIRKLRLDKGLSQDELAFQTDLHQSQIYRLENGKQRFNSDQLEKISEVLGVPIIKFFEFEDNEVGERFNDMKLMEIISQMPARKKRNFGEVIKVLQDFEGDLDVEILKKAIEFIKLAKES